MKLGNVNLSNFSVNNMSLRTKSVKHDKLSKFVDHCRPLCEKFVFCRFILSHSLSISFSPLFFGPRTGRDDGQRTAGPKPATKQLPPTTLHLLGTHIQPTQRRSLGRRSGEQLIAIVETSAALLEYLLLYVSSFITQRASLLQQK